MGAGRWAKDFAGNTMSLPVTLPVIVTSPVILSTTRAVRIRGVARGIFGNARGGKALSPVRAEICWQFLLPNDPSGRGTDPQAQNYTSR